MKIHPVGTGLFRTDGRTYMTKLIAGFRNFAKGPKSTQIKRTEYKNTRTTNKIEVSSTADSAVHFN